MRKCAQVNLIGPQVNFFTAPEKAVIFAGGANADSGDHPYEQGLVEFYRGAVVGEAVVSALLAHTENRLEQLKLAHLLQRKTETKAWPRPHMSRADLSVAELEEWRTFGQDVVGRLAPLEWPDLVRALAAPGPDLVRAFGDYAEAARRRGETAQATVCDFMADHEAAIGEFFRMALDGAEPGASLEPLMRHSRYPLPPVAAVMQAATGPSNASPPYNLTFGSRIGRLCWRHGS